MHVMKSKIREEMKGRRGMLTDAQVMAKSRRAATNLISLAEFKKAKGVMFYVSAKNEVDTHKILKKLLEKKEKRIAVPCLVDNMICPSWLDDFSGLKQRSFGIYEPEKPRFLDYDEIGLVVVPGVSFDRKGNRIGFGTGCYDAFLASLSRKIIKVGLAYDFQVTDSIPCERHDVPIDIIITDKEVIRVRHRKQRHTSRHHAP